MFPLFPLGQIVATPGALSALERAKQPPACFLARHAIGDWGELEPTDVAENKYSLIHGFRLLSSLPDECRREALAEPASAADTKDRNPCSSKRTGLAQSRAFPISPCPQ